MKIVVTGSRGFIGRNLCVHLQEQQHDVLEVHRETPQSDVLLLFARGRFCFSSCWCKSTIRPKLNFSQEMLI